VEGIGTEIHRGYWRGSLKERGGLEDLRVDGKIILKYISRSRMGRRGLDLCSPEQRQLEGCRE
jgi:hypothetical protein